MNITMYRNIHSDRVCIATYIMKMDRNALAEIVNEENIFTSTLDNGALGFYYGPYRNVLVHDEVWIVKYGYNDYMMYSKDDFFENFVFAKLNLDSIQEYIRNGMEKAFNKSVYEEILKDILKLV